MYRLLGSWEHILWLCDQAHPVHFSLTAQIRGEFCVEQLKQALAQVQQRHPLLRVRIVLDEAERPWFVEDAALGFGSGAARAAAQATYPFEAIYNTEITFSPITPNISEVNEIGESGDAPYGLTNFVDIIYTEFDASTGVFTFGSDPARFGLEDLPIGTRTFFGNGSDKLFGTISGTAAIDLGNLVRTGSATITITGGEGRFMGATGILDLSTNDPLTSDPTAPTSSQVLISGSIQTVPEPSSNITLIGIKVIWLGFLLHKRCSRRKSAV